MPSATQETKPTARPEIVLRRVGSEWVLFDAATDRAHVLNLTAAVVWTYCDGTLDSEAIAAAISRELGETTAVRIRADVEAVLQRFAAEGLLR